jgi:hypothetical protein
MYYTLNAITKIEDLSLSFLIIPTITYFCISQTPFAQFTVETLWATDVGVEPKEIG